MSTFAIFTLFSRITLVVGIILFIVSWHPGNSYWTAYTLWGSGIILWITAVAKGFEYLLLNPEKIAYKK
ncbi:MAG TPA: hypothetical protein VGE63_01645 [Candidatus Paceibacterota bacterium]